ncbi:MAG TPA: hypothetical protein VHH73_12695, partial [Verrucomicrobiae bacterium]|nr:hypothetical protein [Verrucomicrobiae bacterium]
VHAPGAPTRPFADRQWQSVGSSCLTFLGRREALRRNAAMFRTYLQKNTDLALWMAITKHRALFPIGLTRVLLKEPGLIRYIAQSWWFGWRQILFGQRSQLWKPAPTIAAHLEVNYMPPGFDWPAIFAAEAGTPR